MSKRLQVLLDEPDWHEIQQVARRKGMTVAEWVRQTLRAARRREPSNPRSAKLDAVRMATRFAFPTADMRQMLEEIERGYGAGGAR